MNEDIRLSRDSPRESPWLPLHVTVPSQGNNHRWCDLSSCIPYTEATLGKSLSFARMQGGSREYQIVLAKDVQGRAEEKVHE